MADDQSLTALRAQVAALETQFQQMHADFSGLVRPPFVIHTHVHPVGLDLCYMPPPPGGDDDTPIRQQLGRIEEQLERVIALLEQRGT